MTRPSLKIAADAAKNHRLLDELSPEQVEQFKGWAASEPAVMRSSPIVAKGDSWFDFLPTTDIIDCMRALHQRNVLNFSKAGDTLENMIFGSQVDSDGTLLSPGLTKALAAVAQVQPNVFLFSGGGNDVAGQEFVNYLNHHRANPGQPLREELARYMIHEVFAVQLQYMVDAVSEACARTRVVMHGYGHAYPSGKGAGVLFLTFVGPWLKPGLDRKGIEIGAGAAVIRRLIDDYNDMLAGLQLRNPGRFTYVDLRPLIKADDWRDEMHLKGSAYAKVSDEIERACSAG